MVRDNFAVSCHSQFQVQAVRIGLKLPELSPTDSKPLAADPKLQPRNYGHPCEHQAKNCRGFAGQSLVPFPVTSTGLFFESM